MKQEENLLSKHLHLKRIIAFLGEKRELVKMCPAKIFTTNKYCDHWLDSGLEGYLCFIMDREYKTRFFVMYSLIEYNKIFEFEIYNNFKSYYQQVNENFYCFEFGEGFIGFQFLSVDEATMFKLIIEKFDDKLLAMMMSSKISTINNKEILLRNMKIVKEKFSSKTDYGENYIEDKLYIIKPRYFEILNNIKFDKENNQFLVEGEETKELLKNSGLKKHQMKDVKLALEMFRDIIIALENSEKKKIPNKRPPHSFTKRYKKKGVSNEEDQLNRHFVSKNEIVSNVNKVLQNNNDNVNESNVPNVPNVPNIPNIPNVPKNIPIIPQIKIPVISKETSEAIKKANDNEISDDIESLQNKKENELQNIVLKKAEKKVEEPEDAHSIMKRAIEKGVNLTKAAVQENKKITMDDKNIISQALNMALQQRMKDVVNEDKEDEDSDWD